MNLLEKIQKIHKQQNIERKDFSFKDLFKDTNVVELDITGLYTKLVDKYHTETQSGNYTMITLLDGKKTGCFSNGLYEFAKFFYSNCGLDINANRNELKFDGYIKVKATKVNLPANKTTYNFEIIGGDIKQILNENTERISEGDIKYLKG